MRWRGASQYFEKGRPAQERFLQVAFSFLSVPGWKTDNIDKQGRIAAGWSCCSVFSCWSKRCASGLADAI